MENEYTDVDEYPNHNNYTHSKSIVFYGNQNETRVELGLADSFYSNNGQIIK